MHHVLHEEKTACFQLCDKAFSSLSKNVFNVYLAEEVGNT